MYIALQFAWQYFHINPLGMICMYDHYDVRLSMCRWKVELETGWAGRTITSIWLERTLSATRR